MKPLIVLLIASVISLLSSRFITGELDYTLAGNVAMAVMLVFTAYGHFLYVDGLAMMVPEILPAKKLLVYTVGIMEVFFAAGLCLPSLRRLTADLLVLFFLLILPANIHASNKSIDYETATNQGRGPSYLWIRIPMQIFFIAWAAYFGIIMDQGE